MKNVICLLLPLVLLLVSETKCKPKVSSTEESVNENELDSRPFGRSDCQKDIEEGREHCRALIPVYRWNNMKQKCESAFYGGCNKTKNNFRTLKECEDTAGTICKK
ncbi:unnamed protein product [Acanthoscelides obtectus]|uniref:BPTI/Kunitz inhibitor domain-containing protein n=1 Tax=Acanthoscelides obtectus TaxID=200917 RepID=A0A9P0LPL5_ACAOB|nr:unnamed protein product [Acanthoscelides obtectus]CAK1650044.1 hypothetical protein AOBTE_LOCUS16569 [Acanthoscelides obtectus]